MTARTLEAGVQPAPGVSTLEHFLRRWSALRRLSFCTRAIAELELLDEPSIADALLLAKYRAAAERLVAELQLVRP